MGCELAVSGSADRLVDLDDLEMDDSMFVRQNDSNLPLPEDGAAVGIEVEYAMGTSGGGIEQPYLSKVDGKVRLPMRDADCLAENEYFHLECDGSSNQGAPRVKRESDFLASAVNQYGTLPDEKKAWIQGAWNGASSRAEEQGHWGFTCLVELVTNPISTTNLALQKNVMRQVGKVRNALAASNKKRCLSSLKSTTAQYRAMPGSCIRASLTSVASRGPTGSTPRRAKKPLGHFRMMPCPWKLEQYQTPKERR